MISRILILFLLYSPITVFSQIVGGREPGEMAPGKVSPTLNTSSVTSESVSTFNGSYSYTYPLASLKSSGGLSFKLNLNYSPSFTSGGSEMVAEGIPYGNGWNLDLPRITAKSSAYRKFTMAQMNTYLSAVPNVKHATDVFYNDLEGDLFVNSIHVSIPGKLDCEAIFKYTDKNGRDVFVPKAFEDYATIYKMGANWEVVLSDGTKYLFNKPLVSYRAGSNRVSPFGRQKYGSYIQSFGRKTQAQFMLPKEEILSWYVTQIRNSNLPGQLISFHYKEFGKFNYFKEFNEQKVIESLFYPTSLHYGSVGANYKDFSAYKELLLQEIVSHNTLGSEERIILEYETSKLLGPDMLNFRDEDTHRKDSLYNYKQVYNEGSFDGWKRYHHGVRSASSTPLYKSGIVVSGLSGTNPYLRNHSGSLRYKRTNVNTANAIPFDHCYLESDRIRSNQTNIPGDIYELKTKISSSSGSTIDRYCNFDFNIVSGPTYNLPIIDPSNDPTIIDPIAYDGQGVASESIFSTFNSALKWNIVGNDLLSSQGHINTSNYFSMPNLPSAYDGFYVQVGPANSDHTFNMHPAEVNASNGKFSAYKAYNMWQITGSSANASVNPYYNPIPKNFGIGMPWYHYQDLHKTSSNTNSSTDEFQFWFKPAEFVTNNATYNNHHHQPTLAKGNTNLVDVELYRYSKNPFMLKEVKKYVVGGLTSTTSIDGLALEKHLKIEYRINNDYMIDNQNYDDGDPYVYKNIQKTTYLLDKIREFPTNPSLEDRSTFIEPDDTTLTYNFWFKYSKVIENEFNDGVNVMGNFYVMTKHINPLGKEISIEYRPIEDSSTFKLIYMLTGDELERYYNKAIHYKTKNTILQFNPVVKRISTKDGNNSYRHIDYRYEGSTTKSANNKQLTSQYFDPKIEDSRLRGFKIVKKYYPNVGNDGKKRIEYHNYDINCNVDGLNGGLPTSLIEPLMGGKIKKIKYFDHENNLEEELEYTHKAVKAYENGFSRINNNRRRWDFDYEDYWIDRTATNKLKTAYIDSYDDNNPCDFPIEDMHLYEKEFNSILGNYASYFIYTSRQKKITYDNQGLVLNSTTSVPSNSESDEDEGEQGYINNSIVSNSESIIENINTSEEYNELEPILINNSPLSDEILKLVLLNPTFQEQTDYSTLLDEQQYLSDSIYLILLSETLLLEKNVISNFLADKEIILTERVLNKFIENSNYIATSLFEAKFNDHKFLEDSLLTKLILSSVDETIMTSIITNQDSLTEEFRRIILNGLYEFSEENLQYIITAHEPFPGDSTLIALVTSHATNYPNMVMNVLKQIPVSPSNNLITEIGNNAAAFTVEDINYVQSLQQTLPIDYSQCLGTLSTSPLKKEVITDYDYYYAQFDGKTDAEAYKQLFQVTDANIYLRHEPSWKLFSTKTYEEVNPTNYQKEINYYYFDLLNKFDRFTEYYNDNQNVHEDLAFNGDWNHFNEGGSLTSIDRSLVYFIGPSVAGQPRPNFSLYPLPLSRAAKHFIKLGIRDVKFSVNEIKSNGLDNVAFDKSTFFEYSTDWGDITDDFHKQVGTIAINSQEMGCQFLSQVAQAHPCLPFMHMIPGVTIGFNRQTGKLLIPAPLGAKVFRVYKGGRESYFYMFDEDITRENCVFAPETTQVAREYTTYSNDENIQYSGHIPFHYFPLDENENNLETPERIYEIFPIDQNTALLSKVYTEIDTTYLWQHDGILTSGDPNIVYGNKPNSLFGKDFQSGRPSKEDPTVTEYDYDLLLTKPHLKTLEILDRHAFFMPKLVENEKGVQTRYHFDKILRQMYLNTYCYNFIELVDYGNFINPSRITINSNKADSIYTLHEFYKNGALKKSSGMNGSGIFYNYDIYGRLHKEYSFDRDENLELLKQYDYSLWDGDQTKDFTQRMEENYLETIAYGLGESEKAIISRSFINPLGVNYQTITAELLPQFTNKQVSKAQFSGIQNYDLHGRLIEKFKPFEYEDFQNTFDLTPRLQSNDLTKYPNLSQKFDYYNNWRDGIKESTDYGAVLGGNNNVHASQNLIDASVLLCELNLTQFEANIILPQGTNSNRTFARKESTDQDGKTVYEYFDAMDRKIASVSDNSFNDAITIYGYDDQGNLNIVVNPNNQLSKYHYNWMGWMYQKETTDGGITKYMFDESGLIVLSQDELGKLGREYVDPLNNSTPYQKKPYVNVFKFDNHNRLVSQGEAFVEGNPALSMNISPLEYRPIKDGDPNNFNITNKYFEYAFTNSSTYAWRAKAVGTIYDANNSEAVLADIPIKNIIGITANRLVNVYHKGLDYQFNTIRNPALVNMIPSNDANNKGKLLYQVKLKDNDMYPFRSHSVASDSTLELNYYVYDNKGRISNLSKQISVNGFDGHNNNYGFSYTLLYEDFSSSGIAQSESIDLESDGLLDFHFYKELDSRERLHVIYADDTKSKKNGIKLIRYEYDDAYGHLTKKQFFTVNNLNNSSLVETITNSYDHRDRLTASNSIFLDYELYYDNNSVPAYGNLATTGDLNHNGNINGIKTTYKFTSFTNGIGIGDFTQPTFYSYSYDQLNRLILADCIVGDRADATLIKQMGYSTYSYDLAGNISSLERVVNNLGQLQSWTYDYAPNKNLLLNVNAQSANTTSRSYTYDVSGNITSDNSRGITAIDYNQSYLPTGMNKINNGESNRVEYNYNSAGNRMSKFSFVNNGSLATVESGVLYLTDLNNQTLATMDLTKSVSEGGFNWYVNGMQREAMITDRDVSLTHGFNGIIMPRTSSATNHIPEFTSLSTAVENYYSNSLGSDESLLLISDIVEGSPITYWDTQSAWESIPEGENNAEILADVVINSLRPNVILKNEFNQYYLTSLNEIRSSSTLQNQYDTLPYYGELAAGGGGGDLPSFSCGSNSTYVANYNGNFCASGFTDVAYPVMGGGYCVSCVATPPSPAITSPLTFYNYDHLGNTRVVYQAEWDNSQNQVKYTLKGAYDYFPYGKILRKFVGGNGIERYLTTQHERDEETISNNTDGTGYDYRINRFYDSDIARFTTVDKLADHPDQLDKSPYAYVWNNPIMLTDPDGNCPVCPIILGGAIGLGVGMYDLSQQYGSFSGAMDALWEGKGNARSHLAITTSAGALLGTGGGLIEAAVIGGGSNALDQYIQNDFDGSKIEKVQVGTAATLAGAGSAAGKAVNNAITKPVTQKAAALNPFVEKTINNGNNVAKVLGAEAGVVLSTNVAEKVTNSIMSNDNVQQSTSTYTPSVVPHTPQEDNFSIPGIF